MHFLSFFVAQESIVVAPKMSKFVKKFTIKDFCCRKTFPDKLIRVGAEVRDTFRLEANDEEVTKREQEIVKREIERNKRYHRNHVYPSDILHQSNGEIEFIIIVLFADLCFFTVSFGL
jgi:hypothetical protein